ncbi:hypothetical protein JHW43_009392 [Diplocarpon mali]|nr:hypothetical protein JHW43_009392 [Diplocarpon mali]
MKRKYRHRFLYGFPLPVQHKTDGVQVPAEVLQSLQARRIQTSTVQYPETQPVAQEAELLASASANTDNGRHGRPTLPCRIPPEKLTFRKGRDCRAVVKGTNFQYRNHCVKSSQTAKSAEKTPEALGDGEEYKTKCLRPG